MPTPSRPTSRTSILKTSGSSRRSTLGLVALLLGGASVVMAQGKGVTLTGAVTLGYGHPTPLSGATVILHRVTMLVQGPIDSARLDVRGRYRLRVATVDSTATYLISVFHDGVAYFSEPLRPSHLAAVTPVDTLRVYDTASDGPPLGVGRRLVSIASPKPDGSRDVLELLELSNPGEKTRIAADTLHPVWAGTLPAGVLQFSVGQGDFSGDAVARHGDSVALFGAVQPGGGRQLDYGYVIPGGTTSWRLPVDHPLEALTILVEDTTARVIGPGLRALGVRAIEARRFAEYRMEHLRAGAIVSIAFPGAPFRVEAVVPFIAVLGGAALVAGLWWALRRRA